MRCCKAATAFTEGKDELPLPVGARDIVEHVFKPYRWITPLVALLLFLSMTLLYAFGDHGAYVAILRAWGVAPGPFGPFVDMHGLVSAWQCHSLGIDVIEHDPCDILDRPFNYSPLWLLASPPSLPAGSTVTLAWGCDLLFVLSLVFLPPPRRARDAALVILATLSTMVAFAVERANPDTIIFILCLLAGFLALRTSWMRFAGYGVALIAGLLKYYPLALLALTARERVRRFLAFNAVAVSLVLIFVARNLSDIERGLPLIANGSYFTDWFAAKNLPFGIAQLLGSTGVLSSAPIGSSFQPVAYGVYALLLLGCAHTCRRILRVPEFRQAMTEATPWESMLFLIGSILITGCFFAGQSTGYRGIFLLFVLPGLFALSHNETDRSVRSLGGFTSALVIFLMWSEFFRTNLPRVMQWLDVSKTAEAAVLFALWFLRELAWWWLISVMLAVITDFLLRSELGLDLSTAFKPRSTISKIRVAESAGEDLQR